MDGELHLHKGNPIYIESRLKEPQNECFCAKNVMYSLKHHCLIIHHIQISAQLKKQLDSSVFSTQIISSHAKQRAIIVSQCAKGLF